MECTDNPLRDKICLVCGDKALGYNFNAVTCESCKAFFRRNAMKDKEYKCPFNKKCEINTVTRRFCQFCRLVKCFEVGMKKEYIMSDEEKKAKRKKIELRKVERSHAESATEELDENVVKRTKLQSPIPSSSTSVILPLPPQPLVQKVSRPEISPISRPSPAESDKNLLDFDLHNSKKGPSPSNADSASVVSHEESEEEQPAYEVNDYFERRQRRNYYSPETFPKQSEGCYSRLPETEENVSLDLRRTWHSPPRVGGGESTPTTLYDPNPLSSPGMTEPSSPVGSAVTGHRSHHLDTSQSRSAEIYQLTKTFKRPIKVARSESDIHAGADAKGIMQESVVNCGEGSHSARPMPLLSSLMGSASTSSQLNRDFRADLADQVFKDIPNQRGDLGNSIDSILTEAIKLEYEAYSSMNPRISSRELNDAERAKLNELIVANKALLAPVEDDVTSGLAQAMSKNNNLGLKPMLVDVLNLTAVAIRRLIKMSKKVNAFKNMCQEDQVALLKGGCTEMMILRSAMTYDSDRGSWKIPHSAERPMNIKVDVLKEAGGRVFEEHQRFLQTFDPRWRNDENIMIILSAITLFTPDRPRVVHYDVIKLEQNSYYYLLRRYLESIYPGCEARSTFLKLIHKISELHRLNEDHVRVYMELNPVDVEPLLIEIFDLTH